MRDGTKKFNFLLGLKNTSSFLRPGLCILSGCLFVLNNFPNGPVFRSDSEMTIIFQSMKVHVLGDRKISIFYFFKKLFIKLKVFRKDFVQKCCKNSKLFFTYCNNDFEIFHERQ